MRSMDRPRPVKSGQMLAWQSTSALYESCSGQSGVPKKTGRAAFSSSGFALLSKRGLGMWVAVHQTVVPQMGAFADPSELKPSSKPSQIDF